MCLTGASTIDAQCVQGRERNSTWIIESNRRVAASFPVRNPVVCYTYIYIYTDVVFDKERERTAVDKKYRVNRRP